MLQSVLKLLFTADSTLLQAINLSLFVSITATVLAASIAIPLGAWIALASFRGRSFVVVILNSLMGLPPVVVGLLVYLLLSRVGPLGRFGILFTPSAMILAQAILVAPIVAALTRQTIADLWAEYRDEFEATGLSGATRVGALLWEGRFSLVTALLAGFGRAIAEVGAVIIVGGNIAGFTRTMTTTIALETSKGDLERAVALGIVLVAIVVVINALVWMTRRAAERLAA
jgi:tungstate transport system permease protein